MNLANSILSTEIKNESILDKDDLVYLNELQSKLDEQLIALDEHERYIKQVEAMHLEYMPKKQLYHKVKERDLVDYKMDEVRRGVAEMQQGFIRDIASTYSQYLNDKYSTKLFIGEDEILSLYRIKNLKEELLPHYENQLSSVSLSESGINLCKDEFLSMIDYQTRLVIKDKSIKFDFSMFNTSFDFEFRSLVISHYYRPPYDPKTIQLFRALSLFEEGSLEKSNHFKGFPIFPKDEIEFKTYKIDSKDSRVASVRYLKTDNRIEVKFRTKKDTQEFIEFFDILSLPYSWKDARDQKC